MKNVGIISLKELKSYLTSPIAYVVTAIFLVFSGAFFVTYLVISNYMDTSIKGFLDASQVLILLIAALLTMRLVAEEKRQGTWELMLTVPVADTEIVLGKFLASLAMLTGMLALTLYYPIMLLVYGDPDIGPIITSYLGLFLLGCASLAIGIFASSLTAYQIVSAVVAGGILFGLWFLGVIGNLIPGTTGQLFSYISLSHHFPDFIRGIIDTKAIVYYLSITTLFLYLAVKSIGSDRWR